MSLTGPGLVQIFWGDGKGKTTAALGAALRACGGGYSVHLVQFMKNGASSLATDLPGEITALKNFSNFSFARFGTGDWMTSLGKEAHRKVVEEAYQHVLSSFAGGYDLIIADEILYAVQLGLLDEEKVIILMKEKPKNTELILTGANKPLEAIFAHAHLVSQVKKIKHPFDSNIQARKGIEY